MPIWVNEDGKPAETRPCPPPGCRRVYPIRRYRYKTPSPDRLVGCRVAGSRAGADSNNVTGRISLVADAYVDLPPDPNSGKVVYFSTGSIRVVERPIGHGGIFDGASQSVSSFGS